MRVAFLAATLLALTSCSSDDPPAVASDRVEVRYFVEGDADSVSITIETPTGTSQQDDVDVPMMSKDGTEGLHFMASPGAFVYIAAQNDDSSGELVCRIEIDGLVVSENRSSGAYSIATCKGSV